MKHYLDAAEKAARAAGDLLRQNFQRPLRVNSAEAHDIKLEIDVRTQDLITHSLLEQFPQHGDKSVLTCCAKLKLSKK